MQAIGDYRGLNDEYNSQRKLGRVVPAIVLTSHLVPMIITSGCRYDLVNHARTAVVET